MSERELPLSLRIRVLARCLLLQSCWSFERMQGLGFGFAIAPFLRRCYEGREAELQQAQRRHLEYFNTQPFMAPLVLGTACALEERVAAAPEAEREGLISRMKLVKTAAASALAGLGDALFWGTLRPACAALAWATGTVLTPRVGLDAAAGAAAATYLFSYNLPVFVARWKGLELGYRWGERLAVELKGLSAQRLVRQAAWTGLGFATLAAAALARATPADERVTGASALLLGFGALKALSWSAARVYLVACGAGALACVAGLL